MTETRRPAGGFPLKGLIKGMGITFRELLKKPITVNYPLEKETPVPRARGVIALDPEACTVCMLCARECPDWCIYIEGHKEEVPPAKEGGRVRTRAKLDRFDFRTAAGLGRRKLGRTASGEHQGAVELNRCEQVSDKHGAREHGLLGLECVERQNV